MGPMVIFQHLLDNVLGPCEDYTLAYLNDFIVYSTSWEEHLKHLAEVLHRLQQGGPPYKP